MKIAAAGLLAVILLVAPARTLAKVPWSSVEVAPAAPVAGEPLTVVIQFWDDAAHTRPSTWAQNGPDGAALEFVGPAERVPLTLARVGDGTFKAEATLAEGVWRLVAVLDYFGASGAGEVELATVTVAPAMSASAPIGAAVIGVTLVTAGIVWRRRRSTSTVDPG